MTSQQKQDLLTMALLMKKARELEEAKKAEETSKKTGIPVERLMEMKCLHEGRKKNPVPAQSLDLVTGEVSDKMPTAEEAARATEMLFGPPHRVPLGNFRIENGKVVERNGKPTNE